MKKAKASMIIGFAFSMIAITLGIISAWKIEFSIQLESYFSPVYWREFVLVIISLMLLFSGVVNQFCFQHFQLSIGTLFYLSDTCRIDFYYSAKNMCLNKMANQ